MCKDTHGLLLGHVSPGPTRPMRTTNEVIRDCHFQPYHEAETTNPKTPVTRETGARPASAEGGREPQTRDGGRRESLTPGAGLGALGGSRAAGAGR